MDTNKIIGELIDRYREKHLKEQDEEMCAFYTGAIAALMKLLSIINRGNYERPI